MKQINSIKLLFCAMVVIFASCQPINSNFTTETQTVTPQNTENTEDKEVSINIGTKEFSEKYPKKYTFGNLYIEDYSYEPMQYTKHGRHSVQFTDKKVIVRNSFKEVAYSFNIDTIMYRGEKNSVNLYDFSCHNNKYKNVKLRFGGNNDLTLCYIAIQLNESLRICIENSNLYGVHEDMKPYITTPINTLSQFKQEASNEGMLGLQQQAGIKPGFYHEGNGEGE